MTDYSHDELVARACRWLRGARKCSPVLAEFQHLRSREIPDAIGWTSGGQVHVVEAKVSRSDFLRDSKKLHQRTDSTMGTHRWYAAPCGLLTPADLPDRAGLIEPWGRGLRVRVHATCRDVSNRGELEAVRILRVAVSRHELGVGWNAKRFRFDPMPGPSTREWRT